MVRIPNWLGDALLARPLLAGLASARPDAEVCAIGPAPLLALLGESHRFACTEPWPATRAERRALTGRMRAWSPDVALVLPPSFSSAWFAFRTGARERIGFAHEGRSPLLTRAVRRPPRGELHLSREYARLGESHRVAWTDPGPLRVTAAAHAAARALLDDDPAVRPLVVLGPGAVYGPAKRWSPERFAALARRCVDHGDQVIVCGGGGDRAVCEAVASAAGGPVRSLAGRTDLPTQAALLASAALAVCNDSGLAHLAGAAGAPTVALFGSTSSAWTAPLGPRVRVVQRPPVCSPCFQRTCVIGTVCLARIDVESVWRAAREVAA
jgi:heptosyltransferase-2